MPGRGARRRPFASACNPQPDIQSTHHRDSQRHNSRTEEITFFQYLRRCLAFSLLRHDRRPAYAALASTKSDGQGAFLLCVPTKPGAHGGRSTDAKETAGTGASHKAAEKSSAAADKASAAPTVQSFQLVLTTKALTFRNPETFQATGGQLAYREIVFPAKPATSAGKAG
jgi:hypothetical protein